MVSSEPGDNNDHWVNQAVVAYPTADKANAFLQSEAGKWKSCAGQTATMTNSSNKTYRWTFAKSRAVHRKSRCCSLRKTRLEM
uniref:sensor domain-containing protein n=1 Tax=Mycobacterium tilburgii TaxID=44467 RepID=UPI003899585E